MPRQSRQTPQEVGPYKMQEFPANELAAALGLYPSDRNSFDYLQTLALKERLVDVCTRCAIRFGIPDQARKHLGDAIGLPDEPLLRYPHREIPVDPRWESLANALRFPPPGDFPLVTLTVQNTQQLNALKETLPSLLEDLGVERQGRKAPSHRPLFHSITREVGDKLVVKIDHVKAFGDHDKSPEGTNRAIARNIHRQMRIYIALGPQWTLVNSLESLALTSCALPPPSVRTSTKKSESATTSEQPLHSTRRNLTGERPDTLPPPLAGLTWMWVEHEGHLLPPAWGGPQHRPWGRWEPQFPDTDKHNTSLFGQSSVYFEIDLEEQGFRGSPTKKFLKDLRDARLEFEQERREARREGYFTGTVETAFTTRLLKKQDEALDAFIARLAAS